MGDRKEKRKPIVHTKILFHWTMKETKNRKRLDASEYNIRLKSILWEGEGLKFGEPTENFRLRGRKLVSVKKKMLCFTETRMSDIVSGKPDTMPSRYGDLGIGLHRKYVVRNGGNPVFYINPMDSANIESLLKETERLKWFAKPMNDYEAECQFTWDKYGLFNYDDLEWRIIPGMAKQLEDAYNDDKAPALQNYMVKKKGDDLYLELTKLKPCIECIVFPTESIKAHCMQTILDYFDKEHFPIITTENRLKHL